VGKGSEKGDETKDLTSGAAVNEQLWRLQTSRPNRWTNGKLIHLDIVVFYVWVLNMLIFTVELSGDSEVENGTATSKVVGCE
jgi:hypothetical protein